MKKLKLANSEIVEVGHGSPTVCIVGLVHGDESCGRKILDELVSTRLNPKGRLKIIYANLEAEEKNVRGIDSNLNRMFPGKKNGNLEERTAYELSEHLGDCDYALDIHSTSYPTEPFVISTLDNSEFAKLATFTGLKKFIIMTKKMANGCSLIDYVNNFGGKGISFEAGTHTDETSVSITRFVVYNFLRNLGILSENAYQSMPEKFYGIDVVKVPSDNFKAYNTIKNFALLRAGMPYGEDRERKYSLNYDCYPFLFSDKLIDNLVFLIGDKQIK